jgi:hypothetical protein
VSPIARFDVQLVVQQQVKIFFSRIGHLINRTLATAENRAVEEMRELENARLDRAQVAIWPNVLVGDYRAVMVFLQISQRRANLNGLDSPALVVISPNVRGEMERALDELQQMFAAVEASSIASPNR